MDNVVVFADHFIGYKIVDYLLKEEANKASFRLIKVFSNNNPDAWWPNVSSLFMGDSRFDLYDKVNILEDLNNLKDIDYLLLISWKFILPENHLRVVKKNTLNLHYSLLPKHRGVYPVNSAILYGDKETGVTFHLVNAGIDTGNIVAQKKIPITCDDDSKSLLNKLDTLAFELFADVWERRNIWTEVSFPQTGISSYHSRIDFIKTNQLDLDAVFKASDFINLLRSKKFGEKTSLYFIDEDSGKKYFIHLNLTEE